MRVRRSSKEFDPETVKFEFIRDIIDTFVYTPKMNKAFKSDPDMYIGVSYGEDSRGFTISSPKINTSISIDENGEVYFHKESLEKRDQAQWAMPNMVDYINTMLRHGYFEEVKSNPIYVEDKLDGNSLLRARFNTKPFTRVGGW